MYLLVFAATKGKCKKTGSMTQNISIISAKSGTSSSDKVGDHDHGLQPSSWGGGYKEKYATAIFVLLVV